MQVQLTLTAALLTAAAGTFTQIALAQWDTRGNVSAQLQYFPESPVHSADQTGNASVAAEIEFYRPVGENGSLTITPFARIDQNDSERSHVDFRELLYTHVADRWEARIGLGKVFWGVAESVNLVDIVNQFDSIENDDAIAKLGQPMVNVLIPRDWGNIDLYILPGLRERTFAGVDGRPRLPTLVDTDSAIYESSSEDHHIDFAARVSTTLDVWDVGISAFQGTARDPLFQFDTTTNQLRPFYYQLSQVGIDVQATLESWLLKAELVNRQGDEIDNHIAAVTGFEYSFFDIKGTGADLGIVAEHLYDERRDEATQPFQNDALIGLRLALNDEQSLEGLLGVITDLDGGGQILSLEGSRRFGSNIKASVLLRAWQNTEDDNLLFAFEQEDNIQLDIAYFF